MESKKKWCKKKIKMRLMLIWVNISYLSPSAWDWNHHMKKKNETQSSIIQY